MASRKISELDELFHYDLESDAKLIVSSDGVVKLLPLQAIVKQLEEYYDQTKPAPPITCSWNPPVLQKEIAGYELTGGEFSFRLAGHSSSTVATNAADGTVTFEPVTFRREDVGTYVYTIREVAGSGDFVYDDHELTCNVRVYVDGVELKADAILTGDTVFRNTYTGIDIGTATWSPNIQVALFGAKLEAGRFTFDLLQGETVVQTVENDASGFVPFEEIEFSALDIGEHTYTVKQRGGSDGVTYDGHSATYTLTVFNNNGHLDVGIRCVGSELFSNYYQGEATPVTWTAAVNVALDGRQMQAQEFLFSADYGDSVEQKRNFADGSVSFSHTFYETDVGTHTVTVTQEDEKQQGVTYDLHEVVFTVEVSVADNAVTARTTSVSGETTFNNTYKPTVAPITWSPKITKLVSGAVLRDDQFSFKLEKFIINGKQEIETAKNNADGSVPFSEITFTEAEIGEHKFVVTEVGSVDGYTMDTHECKYTVTIGKLGNETLTLKESVEGNTIFTNEYSEKKNWETVAKSTWGDIHEKTWGELK